MAATQQDLSSAPTPVVNGKTRHAKLWPLELYRSAVGKKWVMALTGVMLLGFVFIHMLGNFKAFFGAESMNHYGEWLRELLVPFFPRTVTLWLLRFGLIGAFFLHIHAAYSLTRMNHRARPERYAGGREYVAATFASRTMRWSGVLFGLYLLFHLADLTWGSLNPDFVRGDTYGNLVNSFERPVIAAFYVVANVALGIHVFHGTWSLFQSLGLNNPRFNRWRVHFARGFATLIVVGNLSFPLSVTFGLLEDEPAARAEVCEASGQVDSSEPCDVALVEAAEEAQG